MQTVWTVFRQ